MYLLDRSFNDVDDLADEAKQWDLDFRQLERGPFRGRLFQFGVGEVHVSDARFGRSLQQKGAPPVGMRTIAVPACPDMQLEWRGKAVDGTCLMVFPKGAELASISGPDFHVYTCTMPESLLAAAGDALAIGGITDVAGAAEAIPVATTAVQRLRNLLSGVCDAIRYNPDALSGTHVGNQVTAELPQLLISSIAQARGRCPAVTGRKRLHAVAKAEAFIERHAANGIGMRDICRAAEVSERTLRYAFVERFGIGPKEFLQAFRLLGVRRELRAAAPQATKVADVANAWGFWHIGQFAADYRARFGELPSDTLRRSGSVEV